GLDASITALGHAGLRLEVLELKMRQSLAAGDADAALDAYRDARVLLRSGDFGSSWNLHQLAATAYAMRGDEAQAQRARARSAVSRDAFRDALPEALQPQFDAAEGTPTAAAAGSGALPE
nr:hypothetical protein [Lysobacter sp.]